MKLSIKQRAFTVILLTLLATPSSSNDFYHKHSEGWFWYQDPPVMEDEKPDDKKEPAKFKTEETPSAKARRQMEAFKKKLDDSKTIALVDPTPKNVEAYMRIQKEMVDRSEHFSKTWEKVVLQRADLNPEVEHPTAQFARHIQNKVTEEHKFKTIQNLSKTYGLIYFFKNDCPSCTGFAPIVKMFAEKYQWKVLAISVDGSPSDQFADVRPDNGIAQALGISTVPSLIAYHGETNEVIPISYAMTSLDQLEKNSMTLVGAQK